MHRLHAAAIIAILTVISPATGYAQDNVDACGAVLCLAGEMHGGSGGGECHGYMARFFDIKHFKKGRFKANWTKSARFDFLSQCQSVDPSLIGNIIARYGTSFGL